MPCLIIRKKGQSSDWLIGENPQSLLEQVKVNQDDDCIQIAIYQGDFMTIPNTKTNKQTLHKIDKRSTYNKEMQENEQGASINEFVYAEKDLT